MIKLESFKGMDNRHRAESLPEGFLRDLINIDVDDGGKLSLRLGSARLYAGDTHSLDGDFFVEGGDLKLLNSDFSATLLESGVGDKAMDYTTIDDTTYFSNGVMTGKVQGTEVTRWGVQPPPVQPVATPVTTGGLFAGDYQYAITWKDYAGEESGTGNAGLVTVEEGGGIQLTKFVTPPTNIEKIAVYVTQHDSETLYLYAEYPRTLADVTISKGISDVPLTTQHGFPPEPCDIIQEHYGRIYLAKGNVVQFTEALIYGMVKPDNFLQFEADVNLIVSLPGMLYIVTDTDTHRFSNIDGEAFPVLVDVKPYGGTKGTLSYDTTTKTAFWLSDKGIVAANSEGISELHYANVAISKFEKGATTIVEKDGVKKLVGSFQQGTASPLLDSKFKADEIMRKGNAI